MTNTTVEVRVPFAEEQFTVSTTAVSLTASKYQGDGRVADLAILTVATDNIRYRVTGLAPTSTVGHQAKADTGVLVYGAAAIRNLQMIRSGAADADVYVTYYRCGN